MQVNVLQWGRGCSAAESVQALSLAEDVAAASMGPRLFSRGKARVAAA